MGLFNYKKTYIGDVPPRSTSGIYCGVSVFRDACYQLVSGFLITYITFSGLLSKDLGSYLAQIGAISIIMVIYLLIQNLLYRQIKKIIYKMKKEKKI